MTWPNEPADPDIRLFLGHRGYLLGVPQSNLPTATGGIVIASTTSLKISIERFRVPILDLLSPAKSDCTHTKKEHTDPANSGAQIDAMFRVTFSGMAYVFVRWKPEQACAGGGNRFYNRLFEEGNLSRKIKIITGRENGE